MSKKAKLRLIVYVIASVLLAATVTLVIVLSNLLLILSTPDRVKGDFVVTFDDTNELTKPYLVQKVNVKSLYRNGMWYLDFDEIANIYGFSVSGDQTQIRYVFRNDTDDMMYLDFENNNVELNGISFACNLIKLEKDGKVYLPLDFIDNFFEGINIVFDLDDKTLLIECEQSCFLNVRYPNTTNKIDKTQIP